MKDKKWFKWFKRIIVVVVVLGLVAFGVVKLVGNKTSNIEKNTQQVLKNLNSYYMEATMEFYKGEDSRTYSLKISYAKVNDVDHFRVSMLDKAINQEQIIIKNDKGVYVLTPALNQVYKFKGEWPLNGQKPYLYQSILTEIQEDCDISKLEDGYLIVCTPEYKNMPSWTRQEMKLTKEYKPVWVHIYDNNNDVAVKISFTKVEMNPTFATNYFAVNDNMEEARTNLETTTSSTIADLPLYPTNADINATLKEVSTITVDDEMEVMLTYSGEQSFTVIETTLTPYETLTEIEVSGEMIDVYGTCGYLVKTDSVSKLYYEYNGIAYVIYSNNLDVEHLLEIATGMETVVPK